jgi:translation initiation factor 1
MSRKDKSRAGGLVYSTDPDYYRNSLPPEDQQETLPKEKQKLKVTLDTKQRAGKVVTLISGFTGASADLEVLGKQLKTRCGTGGSVKDGQVIIQGDYRQKVVTWLKEWGYVLTKG